MPAKMAQQLLLVAELAGHNHVACCNQEQPWLRQFTTSSTLRLAV
jgi:hypothetical protein